MPFQNLLYVGLRDIDHYEQNILNTCNIEQITSEEVNKNPTKVIRTIQDFIDNETFHLSFDVDCMDPSIMVGNRNAGRKWNIIETREKGLCVIL